MAKKQASSNQNLIAALSYLLGPVPVLGQLVDVFTLLTEKKNNYIRFHALQSLIFFSVVIVLVVVLSNNYIGLILIPFLLIAEFVLWILFMWKAFNGELYKFPYIGSISEKKLGRQLAVKKHVSK